MERKDRKEKDGKQGMKVKWREKNRKGKRWRTRKQKEEKYERKS